MIGNQKIWFASLLRGNNFPRLIITWVNINQIPQRARLTWPGRYLPLKQSLSTPLHILCSINSHTPTPTCFFICLCFLYSLFLGHSFLDISVCPSLFWNIWLSAIASMNTSLVCPSQDLLFLFFLRPDHSLLWITLTGVHILYPILPDHEVFENRARVMFEACCAPIVPNTGDTVQ